MKHPFLILAMIVAYLTMGRPLHADSAVWNGKASPQWITAGNWTPNIVPGATTGTTNTDIATFNSGSVLLQLDNNRSIGGLIFDGSLGGRTDFLSGSLVLTSGGTVELGTTATSVTSTNLSVWLPTITIENTATVTNNSSTSSDIIRLTVVKPGASVSTLTLNGANTGNNLLDSVTQGSNTLNLVKSGSGTWNIAVAALSYSGTTTIDGGILNVATLANGGSSSSIGNSSNAASNLIFGGGVLQYNKNGAMATDRLFTIGDANGNTATIDSSGADPSGLFFTNTGAIAFANAAAHTLILTGSSLINEFDPLLSDSGSNPTSLIKDGSDKWILKSSANSYTGGTTILNGVLSVGTMVASTTAVQPLGEGLVTLAGTSASAPGVLQYTGGTTTAAQNITVTTGRYGVIQNTGGGVLTLGGTLSKDGGVLTLAGGSFVVSGTITGPSANSDLVLGSTTYTGTTTVGLTSANSYNGPTVITANSTLLTGVNGALSTATPSAITLGASTDTSGQINTLDLLGTTQTVGSLATAGSRTNQIISSNGSASGTPVIGTTASSSTGSLTVNYSGTSTDTYSGLLGDSNGTRKANNFSLTKTGTGTLALTGANTYTGGTTVSQGTLLANNSSGSAIGTGPLTVASGATIGGTGAISASTFSISGNVIAGNGTNATSTTTITAATGTFTNANLTFNLDTTSTNSSQINIGSTNIIFSNVTLTLNLLGNGVVGNTPYVLIDGTSDGQYSGLNTFNNSQGQKQISDSNLTLSNSGPGSYLILSNGAIEVVVTPEPSTWAMMLGGIGLLIFWRRRTHSLQA